MSPTATRSVGFTMPSMSPPTPTNAIFPSASSVRRRYRTVGVYSAAGLCLDTFGAVGAGLAAGFAGAGGLACTV